MSALLHWFTSPEWAQVVKALLHSLWQAALTASVLAIVLRRVRNPIARYRSSLAALTVIIFATVVTWAIINASSHRPSPDAHNPSLITQTPTPDSTATPEPVSKPETVILIAHNSINIRWTAWLAFTWLAGAILMLARAGFKVAGAEKLRRSCRPLDDPRIETLLAETRRVLGIANHIRVGVTDKLTSPAVVGIMVPMLILPLALLTTLTPEQIRFVLLHELAHIRRRDYLANLFQFLAESLLFFNPAVWWISHQIRREREACCDALATELSGAPADYAQTLVHVAEKILYPAPSAAPAFGDNREPSSLAERIQRLLVPGYRPTLRLTWRAMLTALVFGSVLLFLSAVGTRMTVAAILTPQQRIDVIEKKMTEYGQGHPQAANGPLLITAHVRTADGSPLPEKRQGAIYGQSGNSSSVWSLDIKKDGTVSCDSAHPGEIWVAAYVDGFAPAIMGPFDASNTNRLDVGELVLDRGFDVTIRLADAASGSAIPDAALHTQFWVRGASCTSQQPEDLKTDSNGEAILHHCADQPLTIAVNAPGHEMTDRRFENVHPGETLDLKLKPGAQIAGIVTDNATGRPIAGATVRVIYQKGATSSHYEWNDPIRLLATTGNDGRFVANQLQPNTTYWLGVSAMEHQSIILSNLPAGARDVNARLGPELIVRGQVLGDVKGEQRIDNHYTLYRRGAEVFDSGSWGNGGWVPLNDVNGVMRFEFTNRTAGVTELVDGKGRIFEQQVDAPIDNWVIDLNAIQKTGAVSNNVPKREVIFRFKDRSGTPLTRGTVSVQIPDNLDPKHLTAHSETLQITNGEVRAEIAIGGMTSINPAGMIGYWFSRFGNDNNLSSFQVTNGFGPMIIEVPVIPAGAIYAKAHNADGTPAGGLLFGIREVKRAPDRTDNTPLNNNIDGLSGDLPRKWASGPLPLGGTYRVTGWRTNSFCISEPVTLTGENPTAEVELQFPLGKKFEGLLLDADGQAIANAKLQPEFVLMHDSSFGLNPIFTDDDGHFLMENLTPGLGDYTIGADVPGMTAERVKLDFDKQPQTIRLERGRRIAGYLVESNTSNIIPGAQIRAVVLENDKLSPLTIQTDADGHFEFTQAGNGDYTFFLNCGVPTSQQTYRGNVDTNITLAVKLYPWSTVKSVPRASGSMTNGETIEVAAGTNTPESVKEEEQIQTARLVQDGKLLFQMGKMDEAEAMLTEALKQDPDNQAAFYYLSLVKENRARMEMQTNSAHNLPNATPYSRGNIIHTSLERQEIYQKLNNITFDKIAFPNLPLSEVVRILTEQTELRDPDQKGINFIINKAKPAAAVSPNPAQPTFDPTTGQPIAPAPVEDVDLSSVQISLDPALRNVRLMDVLEAIVKTADHPIKYSLLDYGIEFSFKGPETPELFTRAFKVDPNTFYMGLQNVGSISFGTRGGSGGNAGNGNSAVSIPHVDVAGNSASGAANRGIRSVTSPDTTVDIRTAIINFLNTVGVNLTAPKSVFFNDRQGTLTVRATADDLHLVETAIDKLNVAPPEVSLKVRFVEVNQGSNWLQKFNLLPKTTGTNDQPTVMGILTDPQFRVVLNALTQGNGADVLSEGEVTTLSGRQAQFVQIPTNLQIQNRLYDKTNTPVGITLDVLPCVAADKATLQLTLVTTVRDFAGYNNLGPDLDGVSHIVPTYREAAFTNNSILWDGQTLVFGGVMTQDAVHMKDNVPFLGDLPFVGRLFVSNSTHTQRKNVIIFLTPTLIDSFGHRIHSEDYYDSPPNAAFGRGGGGFGGSGRQ